MKKIFYIFLLLLPVLAKAQIINTIAGNGFPGYTGDMGNCIYAKLNRPLNIKFDHSGNMFIADYENNVIRKISTTGIISTIVGNGVAGYSGDGGPATAAQLFNPVDIAFDTAGDLYIADNGNQVIRKVNNLGTITTIVGTSSTGFGGDNGPATAAKLNDPVGMIFDIDGNLYFSDGGNARVRKVNNLGIISTIAGNGISGFSGDGGPATAAQLGIPNYLGISLSGDIYIADHPNNHVRKVNSFGIISTIAGNGSGGSSGDGGQATAASIAGPDAVVVDDSGNFFISSYVSGVIRKVTSAGIISTVVGIGTLGYGGDGGPATMAQIQSEAICSYVDHSGNLYIADSKNNRIRKVTYNTTAINTIENKQASVSIFPNPAHNEVTIKQNDKIERITIMNAVGQVIFKQSYNKAEKVSVDVRGFATGVYFVKVNGVYAGKFVKG